MIEIRRPVLKPYSKDRFELVENYSYKTLSIPKGYQTNGANIPRVFWSLFPPNSPEYLSAVVAHDFLCDRARKKEDFRQADEIFYEMLKELGVSKIKAITFYLSVRLYHKIRHCGLR